MKKQKTTYDRIKDAADSVRVISIILCILMVVGIFAGLSRAAGNYGTVLLVSGISCIPISIILHAFYCFLYGFADLLENSDTIVNDVHNLVGKNNQVDSDANNTNAFSN